MRFFETHFLVVPLLAAIAAFSTPAFAQDASNAAEARKQFDAGVELFEAGQFEQASVAFARAYELRPSYKILYLVGKCENAQRHFALSLDAYTRYLAEAGDQIDEARRGEVSAEIERLHALVGSIAVETSIDGATIYVDDERRGETPLTTPIFADLGKHTVVVKKGVDELHREVVKVAGGQRVTVLVEAQETPSSSGDGSTPNVTDAADAQPTRTDGDDGKKSRALLIGGITALAVGAGAGVVGGVFAAKRSDAEADMAAARNDPTPGDYNDAKDREKTDKAVMIAGFVGAGVFVAAGAVLVVLHVRSKKAGGQGEVALRPTAGGFAVEF